APACRRSPRPAGAQGRRRVRRRRQCLLQVAGRLRATVHAQRRGRDRGADRRRLRRRRRRRGAELRAALCAGGTAGPGRGARGVTFPGLGFYLQIGRGVDYAWSATSASSDVIDTFAETLCGGDDVHYLYKGECRAMDTFDAGTLKGAPGEPDNELVYRT